MQTTEIDAKKFYSLIDELDALAVESFPRSAVSAKKTYASEQAEIAAVRRKARLNWQSKAAQFIDIFIQLNPQLSEEDKKTLSLWKNKSQERYVIAKIEEQEAIFINIATLRTYSVAILEKELKEALEKDVPVLVETTLLPFQEHIVWDPHTSRFGEGKLDAEHAQFYQQIIEMMKKNDAIISSLQ